MATTRGHRGSAMFQPMWILAQQGSRGALDVSTPLGAVLLSLALAAAVGMLVLWRSTSPSRVRAAPPTMDLRNETPALVDMLTGGFEVEDDAIPATVVDLAARGYFTIDDIGGDRIVLHLRRRQPTNDTLTTYEERVLRHIRSHETEGIVPTQVLTLGPQGVSKRWFKGFVREVTAHGRSHGLCRRRWDVRHLAIAWMLVGLAGVPAMLVTSAAERTTDPLGWGSVGNLLLGLTYATAVLLLWFAQRISRSDAQTDTPAGLEAAAHWMGVRDFYRHNGRFEDKPAPSVALWDRNLAYATALGLAPLVQRQIPFETEHDRHAWSLAGGHWRRVKVHYPTRRPGWGERPISVTFSGLVRVVVFGLVAVGGFYLASADLDLDAVTTASTLDDDRRRLIGLIGLLVAVIAIAFAAAAALRLAMGLSDLFSKHTVEGEVVRQRNRPTGHWLPRPLQHLWYSSRDEMGRRRENRRRQRRYLAIDTGDGDRIRAFLVRPEIYRSVEQGATVRATVSPRLGYVSTIATVTSPRPSAASEAPTSHPLVAYTAEGVTSVLTRHLGGPGGLDEVLAHLEDSLGPDGRQLLDETDDDDGVSLRDRLDASRSQLESLRSGTEVGDDPLLAQILDTLMPDGRPDHSEPPDRTGH